MKTILIVDGNNIAHRVRYKFALSNNGIDVSVTFGFLRVLQSYMRKLNPEAVIVAWDGGIPRYRREKCPSYKANRDHGTSDPQEYEDFLRQLKEVSERSLPLMGVLSVRRKYIEADDLIYHAAKMASKSEYYDRIVVVSADEDLVQCVNISKCLVMNPNKDDMIDSTYVEESYGIPLGSFVHWRALQGDSSDNIGGVPGIGPKTATKLFKEFGTLSGIVNAAAGANPMGTITGKRGQAILDFGIENISKNVYTMVLAYDRTGARFQLLEHVYVWEAVRIKSLKKYLLRNAFVSLMEPAFYKACSNLKQPFLSDDLRIPIVCHYRKALED